MEMQSSNSAFEENKIAIQNMQIKKLPSAFVEPLLNGKNPLDCCEELFEDINRMQKSERSDVGSLVCPHTYFLSMATRDYEDFTFALIREFIQNSDDAKAKSIRFLMDDGEEADQWKNVNRLTVKDNGCGMDRFVLFGRLLQFGPGGEKLNTGGEITGAFCKAKEALFFSWKAYCIRTNNLLVLGKGADFTVYELPPQCAKKGTDVYLQMWNDKELKTLFGNRPPDGISRRNIQDRIKKFMEYYEGKANITLNEESFERLSTKKMKFTENDEFSVFYRKAKNNFSTEMVFQTGNIPTKIDSTFLGENSKYDFMVKLKRHPYECLTSNRDSLKGKTEEAYDKIFENLKEFTTGGSFKEEKNNEELVLYLPEKIAINIQNGSIRIDEGEQKEALGVESSSIFGSKRHNNEIDINSLACENVLGEKKTQKIVVEKTTNLNSPYVFFTGNKSLTLQNAFSNSQQRLTFSLSLWNEVVQKMNSANDRVQVYPGFIFSRQFNEAGGIGCCMEMNQGAGHILFLNPSHFKWDDYSLDGLLILSQRMLMLCSHEMAHVSTSYHNSQFCQIEQDLYRKTIEQNPRIIQELVTLGQILSPKAKVEAKMKQARLC